MNKKEQRQQDLLRHYNNLAALFTQLGGKTATGKILTGRQLSLALFKLERAANKAATDYCNGDIDGDQWEQMCNTVENAVLTLLPGLEGFFCNGDPRGYALKVRNPSQYPSLTKDMGGYGILSPEIN